MRVLKVSQIYESYTVYETFKTQMKLILNLINC